MGELRLWPREQAWESLQMPERDALAFLRAQRMLERGLPLVLSDGHACLVVQETAQQPAWVWTAGDISEEALQALLLSLSALREQNRLPAVVSKNALAKLLSLAFEQDNPQKKQLTVYRMQTLVPFTADGEISPGKTVLSERASELIGQLAMQDDLPLSAMELREAGMAFAESKNAYAWRTSDGTIATIAQMAAVGETYTDIHSVVTDVALRNRGYGKALVSSLCAQILAQNRIPMLYADRSYAPSNHIYREMGFVESSHLTVLRF